MSKRTLDTFFKPSPQAKKSRPETTSPSITEEKEKTPPIEQPPSTHPTYPFPIPNLDSCLLTSLTLNTPFKPPKCINDQPHLDLLYFQPCIPTATARDLFLFLRQNLPFYRVRYTIRRGATETIVNTPRFTTVFGVDETSRFSSSSSSSSSDKNKDINTETSTDTNMILLDNKTNNPIPSTKYKCTPRPLPSCLETLRKQVEGVSDGATYNFCLVNYYASGEDSISYHSDDERFLGSHPTIASLSLGAKRDFLMRHKPIAPGGGSTGLVSGSGEGARDTKPLKLTLASGDMVIMRGETQSNWLHSIPKRKGGEADNGRINITFRKAVVPGGTENYYRYNVGDGEVFRWDEERGEMMKWKEK